MKECKQIVCSTCKKKFYRTSNNQTYCLCCSQKRRVIRNRIYRSRYVRRKCRHGIIKYDCKNCEGGGVCEHSRQRSKCSRCRPEGAYKMCIRNSMKRNISFGMSLKEFKQIVSGSCAFCGETIEPMTCDRINNNIGYRLNNCQPLCNMCNMMKRNYSEQQFYEHITKILRHKSTRRLRWHDQSTTEKSGTDSLRTDGYLSAHGLTNNASETPMKTSAKQCDSRRRSI